jgi:hypothetical protein
MSILYTELKKRFGKCIESIDMPLKEMAATIERFNDVISVKVHVQQVFCFVLFCGQPVFATIK